MSSDTTLVFDKDKTIVENFDDLLIFETKLNRKKLPAKGKSSAWLMADINPQKEFSGVRKRIVACLLIDTSGSMGGNKIEQTREAAKKLVDALASEDYVAMVSFDDIGKVVLKGEHLSDSRNKEKIKNIIDENTTLGGITNLKDGLEKAINEITNFEFTMIEGMPEPVKRIFLLTDGYPNEPFDYPEEEFLKTASELKQERNVQITTIGIGDDYGINLLDGIAKNSGGWSHHLTDPNMIPAIFEKEVDLMTGALALKPKLFLKFDKSIEVGAVYQARPRVWDLSNKLIPENGGLSIDLSDITQKVMQSYLIDLRIPKQDNNFNGRVGEVTLELMENNRKYSNDIVLEFADEVGEIQNPEVMDLAKAVLDKIKIQNGQTLTADDAKDQTIIDSGVISKVWDNRANPTMTG